MVSFPSLIRLTGQSLLISLTRAIQVFNVQVLNVGQWKNLVGAVVCWAVWNAAGVIAQDAEGRPKLRWFGQSFFQLETSFGKKIVFDPHAIEAFGRPEVTADFVCISHPHNDHSQPEVLANKGYRVFQGVRRLGSSDTRSEWIRVDETLSDRRIRIRNVGLYHDALSGMQRGKNSAFIIETDGLTFVHLGDLGHTLTPEQIKAIGPVDVLMIPVGGIYTLNGEQAVTVVEQLKPRRFIIPMHYGLPHFDDLLGPDEFLDGLKHLRKVNMAELVIDTEQKPDQPTVVMLDWKPAAPPKP